MHVKDYSKKLMMLALLSVCVEPLLLAPVYAVDWTGGNAPVSQGNVTLSQKPVENEDISGTDSTMNVRQNEVTYIGTDGKTVVDLTAANYPQLGTDISANAPTVGGAELNPSKSELSKTSFLPTYVEPGEVPNPYAPNGGK